MELIRYKVKGDTVMGVLIDYKDTRLCANIARNRTRR